MVDEIPPYPKEVEWFNKENIRVATSGLPGQLFNIMPKVSQPGLRWRHFGATSIVLTLLLGCSNINVWAVNCDG